MKDMNCTCCSDTAPSNKLLMEHTNDGVSIVVMFCTDKQHCMNFASKWIDAIKNRFMSSWICDSCETNRPDAKITTISVDANDGQAFFNVKFCSDSEECCKKARILLDKRVQDYNNQIGETK